MVLLVDPASYTPAATEITNPALDPGVLAWTEYPPGPVSVSFSGRTWGIKVTGSVPEVYLLGSLGYGTYTVRSARILTVSTGTRWLPRCSSMPLPARRPPRWRDVFR